MAGSGASVINFGAVPVSEGVFAIADANITSSMAVEAFVQVDSTVDNDTESHRHAAVSWRLSALAGSGGFTLYTDALVDLCYGTFNIRYAYA
jgi:hypothetical protein